MATTAQRLTALEAWKTAHTTEHAAGVIHRHDVPPVTPPVTPPTGVIVQFPGSGPATPAALVALMQAEATDIIEIGAGTYPKWVAFLNVARTRPLLVRPKGDVIWDGGGNGDPAWRIGWGGFASHITFDPSGMGRFLIQNYRIGAAGLVMARWYDTIAMNGVIVRNCTGTGTIQTSHSVYLDSDGTHRGKGWQSNGWDIIGPADRKLSGLHIYHEPSHDGIEAKGWTVENLHRWVYGWANPTGIVIDGWTGKNCNATIDTEGSNGAQGVVKNCHATNCGPLERGKGYWTGNNQLVDGGGNA